MDIYARVFENNRRWIAERTATEPDFFSKMAQSQNPHFLYIGCADSRVPPTQIMGLDPGDMFVHRNIANLVVNTDANVQACIQYAVEVLGVEHIVVCGHYGCGGVKAAMQSADLGALNGWLREVRDVYRHHADALDAISDPDTRYDRLVEVNVLEQCMNIIKTSWVQRSWHTRGFPRVHGWVYSLEQGLLIDLDVPFEEILANVEKIYKIV